MLNLGNVSKSFGALTAVNDVSFTLQDTGISGLIGPNGSGKTTLFHLITGFYTLDKGNIIFIRFVIHCLTKLNYINKF